MDAIKRRTRPAPTNGEGDLFGQPDADFPDGFRYVADLLTAAEEESLKRELAALPFEPFDFHGYKANRHVVGFGFRYDYGRRQTVEAPPLPSFLHPLRRQIADTFGRPAEAFRQALINQYRPGAGIGWHRDKPQFDEVVGVSLLAPCTFRFRRKKWGRLGSRFAYCRAALGLSAFRTVANGLGAQCSAARPSSLLHHLQDDGDGADLRPRVSGGA